jgi:putative peptidoglycan lipid II flippase
LFIGLPATVGLVFVREPLTRVIFERGAFTPSDTARVAWVLVGYASAVWAYSMTHVLTRACYAKQDSTTPLKISLANVALNLTLNLILIWPMGVAGLAWSTAICAALQTAALLVAVRRHVDTPVDASVLAGWWQTAGLSLVMGAALWTTMRWIDPTHGSLWSTAGALALLVVIGGGVYLGGALLFRMDELKWLLQRNASAG